MKAKFLLSLLSIFFFNLVIPPAYAITDAENERLKNMSYQAARLQAELDQLQQEIHELKQDKAVSKKQKKSKYATHPTVTPVRETHDPYTHVPTKISSLQPHGYGKSFYNTERDAALVEAQNPGTEHLPPHSFYPHTLFRNGSVAVVTSPYIGVRSDFDGGDLIVNLSSINEDLRLLEQSQIIHRVLREQGGPPLNHPLIELSGKVEALAIYNNPFVGPATIDADLGSLQLTTTAILNSWALGFMSFDFDGTPPVISGKRVDNSRLYLSKGFLTLGNLNVYPFYTTWGQFYVPFGRYSSNMLSAPLPLSLARTKNRNILLGYRQPGDTGIFAQAYVFSGDADPGSRWNGGGNIGYAFATKSTTGEAAFGIMAGLADSDGMQSTGGSGFSGFAGNLPGGSEDIIHQAPAADLNFKLAYGKWGFITEYVTAIRRFDPRDLAFNGRGALPSAFNLEAAYHFSGFGKPWSVALGYGFSDEAFALNLSRHRLLGALNVSWIRDTIETLEIRHDWAYALGTTGAGRTSSTTTTDVSTAPAGQELTTATMQIGLYF